MILPLALALLLAVAPEDAEPEKEPENAPEKQACIPVTGIYLPEAERSLAPHIKLMEFQYSSPDDPCGDKMPRKLLMTVHERLTPIAVEAFSGSQSTFGVMVRLTLTPEAPPVFEMRVSNVAEKEKLSAFYAQGSEITDLHSTDGPVLVVFRYLVFPTQRR